MKRAVNSQRSAVILRKVFVYCLLLTAYCSLSCSIPNLQAPECTAATQTVKELYSYHFGNDMKFTRENLKLRERFLSAKLIENLSKREESASDYFTQTSDYPKAFRIGKCTVLEQQKRANFAIVLFWKTDTRSEQREIPIEVVRENDEWLVERAGN